MRQLSNSQHRKEVAEFWNIPVEKINPVPGKSILDIIEALHRGEVKALWVATTNPAASLPNTKWVEEGLQKAELLIVQDIFHPTETTMLADVVFAAAQWSEKTGTFISSDRRVQLVEKLIDPPGIAKPDYEIIWMMVKEMGFEKKFPRADGRAALLSRDYIKPKEVPDSKYPFYLNSGKTVAHFNTRTRTGRIKDLNKLAPKAIAYLKNDDAQKLNIKNDDEIEITSRRGSISVIAKISYSIRKGDVYINFHYGKALLVGRKQTLKYSWQQRL